MSAEYTKDGREPVRAPIQRIDMYEDFSDVMGDPGSGFQLDNKDSKRHYIWALNVPEDIQKFSSSVLRYQPVIYGGDADEKAVRPRGCIGVLTKGERVVWRGHLLMSCDLALQQKRERYRIVEGAKRFIGERRRLGGDPMVAGAHGQDVRPDQQDWSGLESYVVEGQHRGAQAPAPQEK